MIDPALHAFLAYYGVGLLVQSIAVDALSKSAGTARRPLDGEDAFAAFLWPLTVVVVGIGLFFVVAHDVVVGRGWPWTMKHRAYREGWARHYEAGYRLDDGGRWFKWERGGPYGVKHRVYTREPVDWDEVESAMNAHARSLDGAVR